jgi:hypothetical protein
MIRDTDTIYFSAIGSHSELYKWRKQKE